MLQELKNAIFKIFLKVFASDMKQHVFEICLFSFFSGRLTGFQSMRESTVSADREIRQSIVQLSAAGETEHLIIRNTQLTQNTAYQNQIDNLMKDSYQDINFIIEKSDFNMLTGVLTKSLDYFSNTFDASSKVKLMNSKESIELLSKLIDDARRKENTEINFIGSIIPLSKAVEILERIKKAVNE